MEKIEKIKAEIERLYVYWDGVMRSSAATEAVARKNQCRELLSFIDSLQDETEHEPNIELIQQSWYLEGYADGETGMEPMWIDGPKREKNPRYGEKLPDKDYDPGTAYDTEVWNWLKEHGTDENKQLLMMTARHFVEWATKHLKK